MHNPANKLTNADEHITSLAEAATENSSVNCEHSNACSTGSGKLLYVEYAVCCCSGHSELLAAYAEFVCCTICDSRIVSTGFTTARH